MPRPPSFELRAHRRRRRRRRRRGFSCRRACLHGVWSRGAGARGPLICHRSSFNWRVRSQVRRGEGAPGPSEEEGRELLCGQASPAAPCLASRRPPASLSHRLQTYRLGSATVGLVLPKADDVKEGRAARWRMVAREGGPHGSPAPCPSISTRGGAAPASWSSPTRGRGAAVVTTSDPARRVASLAVVPKICVRRHGRRFGLVLSTRREQGAVAVPPEHQHKPTREGGADEGAREQPNRERVC